MSDHMSAIGFEFTDAESFGEGVGALFASAVEEARSGAGRHLRWSDGSGASMALHLDGAEKIECVTPFLAPPGGLSRWRVRTTAPLDDGSCAHCGGADCDILDAAGELVTRSTIQWLHYQPFRQWLGSERTYDLEVAAFAHAVEIFENAEAFAASEHSFLGTATTPDGQRMRLGPETFLPVGMFEQGSDIGARATVVFTGALTAAQRHENPAGGGAFWHLRVATLPGPIDVAVAVRELESAPIIGGVAMIAGWLVARPVEPPPPPPPAAPGPLKRLGRWLRSV